MNEVVDRRNVFWRKIRQAFNSVLLNTSRRTEIEEGEMKANVYLVGGIVRIDIPRKGFIEGGTQITL